MPYGNDPTAADYAAHDAREARRENESLKEQVAALTKRVRAIEKHLGILPKEKKG
ncbi:hypothetical protein [Rhizobium phage RHEph12]|nr:hypothetical protein [Rhizobium phage RHEph12]